MLCSICAGIQKPCKAMEIQYKNMIIKLDLNINSELAQWICEPCEIGLIISYNLKIQHEAQEEMLRMKLEKERLQKLIQQIQNNTEDHKELCSSEVNKVDDLKDEIEEKPYELMDIKEEFFYDQPYSSEMSSNADDNKALSDMETMEFLPASNNQNEDMSKALPENTMSAAASEKLFLEDNKLNNSIANQDVLTHNYELNYHANPKDFSAWATPEDVESQDTIKSISLPPIIKSNLNNYKNCFRKIDDYFICTQCPTSSKYKSAQSIRHHIKVFHFGYKFDCEYCGFQTRKPYKLKKHRQSLHGIYEPPLDHPATKDKISTIVMPSSLNDQPCSSHMLSNADDKQTLFDMETVELLSASNNQNEDMSKALPENIPPKTAFENSFSENYLLSKYSEYKLNNSHENQEELSDNEEPRQHKNPSSASETSEILMSQDVTKKLSLPPIVKANRYNYKNCFRKIDGKFICTQCPKSSKYKSPQSVRQHIKVVHFGCKFVCEDCGFQANKPCELKKHRQSLHGTDELPLDQPATKQEISDISTSISYKHFYHKVNDQFECKICSVKNLHYTSLIRHIKIKHFGQRYKCKDCPREYRAPRSLKKHVKTCEFKLRQSD